MTKPTNKIYGQNYYLYSVPLSNADSKNVTLNSVTVLGLGRISDVNIYKKTKVGVIIKDTSGTGEGWSLEVTLTVS